MEVLINGVRYVPEDPKTIPDRAPVWYMHDNHTFTRLKGSLSEIIRQARELARKSPYGMLCNVAIISYEGNEIRRLKEVVHATTELGVTSAWEAEIRADPEALQLIEDRS